MIDIVPADPVHLHLIVPQEAQSVANGSLSPSDLARQALPFGPAWAAIHNGRVVFVGGFIERAPHWATAWAILSEGIGLAFLAVTKAVREHIRAAPYARVDMFIDPEFEQSVRWAAHIGMQHECIMHKAKGDGGPMFIFAKVEE